MFHYHVRIGKLGGNILEETTKMVEEITEKRKMTEEVKEKLQKRIVKNGLIAIGVMLYICAMDTVYLYVNQEIVLSILKTFSMMAILVTVGIFELAYRKDSGRIAIVGIELLVFSVIILYLPKVYQNSELWICKILLLTPIFCAIYYMAKSIIIYFKTEKEYQNNLSDVKEILKEET